MEKINVLIMDDSAVMRGFLTKSLESCSDITVVGTAADENIAANKIRKFGPDVIVIDSGMPCMKGFSFLLHLMNNAPLPAIIISQPSSSSGDAAETFGALEAGAFDVMPAPASLDAGRAAAFVTQLVDTIRAAKHAPVKAKTHVTGMFDAQGHDPFSRHAVPLKRAQKEKKLSDTVIAIGASTGGVPVISDILVKLSDTVPAIVIVIHMPEGFTAPFADRMNRLSSLYVSEAGEGALLYQGSALVAPGNRHLMVVKKRAGYAASLGSGERVKGFRPSVDVLFESVASSAGAKGTGIILTGMGNDGVAGLMGIKQSGGMTIAQDRESCPVYGMPREALREGAAKQTAGIAEIVSYINGLAVN
ncbi:MAG TPA: chemotaxis-specific protein-glutamate methyltransferase CheB [Spirochaetota bacterium]|nr:chemotaxis-specific protein-glutamate methyltransferase CheB [Spirochaetota bacterium]HPI88615.1 chemotaxis-specific protein-glutamate methyltransferase CheB [Spirochaetota bacterium]HPR48256.1 chemotaxis-specific protein-glutamate methyltransferase CheB [Spirochaetota bacterium]